MKSLRVSEALVRVREFFETTYKGMRVKRGRRIEALEEASEQRAIPLVSHSASIVATCSEISHSIPGNCVNRGSCFK